MRELFKDCPNSNKLRIDRMNKIIRSGVVGDIRLFPILIINLDDLLLSNKLIQFVTTNQKENRKKLKFVEYFLMKSAQILHEMIDKFRGKVVLISQCGYSRWHDLVHRMPSNCGGDWWRSLICKLVANDDKISVFSLKDVCDDGNAMQIVFEEYFASIQIGKFRKDRKKEIYHVPVVFCVGACDGDLSKDVNQAMYAVFGDYYRLVDYQCDALQVRDGNVLRLQNEQVVIKSLIKVRDSSVIRPFMWNCSDVGSFKEKTWEGLFIGGHGCMLQKYFLNEENIVI